MPSKRQPAKSRPVELPLRVEYTREFKKDWIRLQRSGMCSMARLKALMIEIIANDGPLDPVHREHPLLGGWAGFHECHMGGDVLLIYKKTQTDVVFTRAGSHAALFEN